MRAYVCATPVTCRYEGKKSTERSTIFLCFFVRDHNSISLCASITLSLTTALNGFNTAMHTLRHTEADSDTQISFAMRPNEPKVSIYAWCSMLIDNCCDLMCDFNRNIVTWKKTEQSPFISLVPSLFFSRIFILWIRSIDVYCVSAAAGTAIHPYSMYFHAQQAHIYAYLFTYRQWHGFSYRICIATLRVSLFRFVCQLHILVALQWEQSLYAAMHVCSRTNFVSHSTSLSHSSLRFRCFSLDIVFSYSSNFVESCL